MFGKCWDGLDGLLCCFFGIWVSCLEGLLVTGGLERLDTAPFGYEHTAFLQVTRVQALQVRDVECSVKKILCIPPPKYRYIVHLFYNRGMCECPAGDMCLGIAVPRISHASNMSSITHHSTLAG